MNAFPALDDQHVRSSEDLVGPTYEHEYSTREAYGANIAGWGPNDPLNATWWHKVTEGDDYLFTNALFFCEAKFGPAFLR